VADASEPLGDEPGVVSPASPAEFVNAEPGGLVGETAAAPDHAARRGGGVFVVGRILSMPVAALRNRLVRSSPSGSPDFDALGNPRKRRRVAPFWLWFATFYIVVALTIVATLVLSGASLPGIGPAPSQSAGSTFGASPSASGPLTTGPAVVGPTTGVSPSTTTPISAPVLTVKEQPPTLAIGKNATFTIRFVPGATCTLTRTFVPGFTAAPSQAPKSPVSSLAFPVGADGSATIAWGETAQVGTYSISATCTGSPQSSAPVTVSWN
jgi:hypothetical protein